MKLDTLLTDTLRIDTEHRQALQYLGLTTVRDLLHYFPTRYESAKEIKSIVEIAEGERVSVIGTISKTDYRKTFKSKIAIATARITDNTGSIDLVWFHQPYIAKMLPEASLVLITGTVSRSKNNTLTIANPEYEKLEKAPDNVSKNLFKEISDEFEGGVYPVYPETKGITSNWLHHAVKKILAQHVTENIVDPLPEDMRTKYNLPSIQTALIWIHTPKRNEDAEVARKRFAFQEIFLIQLQKQKDKYTYEHETAWDIHEKSNDIKEFIAQFPFTLTSGQQEIIDTVIENFDSTKPMSRLLEGDVGSGKTAIAATTAYAVATTYPKGQDFGSLQVAYMCPTEILARQHFESFTKYFKKKKLAVGLITGSECRKFPSKVNKNESTHISRTQLLKWVANGEIPILIGTHALIQEKVTFKHLAYVIIDEQHRFGTAQRQKLAQKDKRLPHLLSMTATPIPRTLALTIYGDLDISVLDEMPAGRKPIITEIVLPTHRKRTYTNIEKELKNGRQLYVICPRIDEPDPTKEKTIAAKSVTEEAKRLKKEIFPDYEIGTLHSKMTPIEKEKTMKAFLGKKIDILVATSVVEVGVNIPNATIIVIEGAERFGLAQLHQLRGRVIRSNHQAYCYVFADPKTEKTLDRLQALIKAKNGFELAEYDLAQRGSGMLYGAKQWGITDLGMEAIKNIKMVEAARAEAKEVISENPTLESYPLLQKIIQTGDRNIHFE